MMMMMMSMMIKIIKYIYIYILIFMMMMLMMMVMMMMMMMAADGFGMFCPSCFSFALRPGKFLFLLWDFARHALFHGGFPNSKREMIFRYFQDKCGNGEGNAS